MSEYVIWESDGIEVQGHRVTQHEQREEIVRCSECKWRGEDEWCCNNLRYVMDDGFCAWGERLVR